jgi:hypothetical protein
MAGFNGCRDLIQVSYRCREIKTNKINVCFIDKYNSCNAFENDDIQVANCNIYKGIVANILYEKKAPLKQSFMFLANKAHYKISSDIPTITEGLNDYFKSLFEDNIITYDYNDIPNIINNEMFEELTMKLYNQSSTLEDKLILKKHFYNYKFKTNADKQMLAEGFDNRYEEFFNAIIRIKDDEDNIFYKVQTANNWCRLFPNNEELKKKIILNNDLLDQIFKDFHFKDLKKNSGAHCIMKHIYKAYFKKEIIKTVIDKHNNCKHTINEDIQDMFEYGIENLTAYTINTNIYNVFDDDEESNKLDSGLIFD